MSIRIYFLALVIALTSLADAQNITGNSLTLSPPLTVGTLPSAATNKGRTFSISDGLNSTDCTVGGGTNHVWCWSNGTIYAVPFGSAAGGVTSINTVAGAFTFSGPGVTCTSTACTFSGTGVSSVSNSDGTLTISPNTGAVAVSLALSHANTWTNQTIDGVTPTTFGFVDPTSSIQTQLNAKANSSVTTLSSLTTVAGGAFGSNAFNSTVFEPTLGNPGTSGYVLSSTTGGVRSWVSQTGGMVYPGAGIPNSTGSAWRTSLTQFGSAVGIATTSDPGTTAEVPMVANGTHGTKPSASGALNTGAFAAAYVSPLTLTPLSVGFSVAGGTTSKTETFSNTITFTATSDGETLNIGPGGTLGTGAFAAAYVLPAASSGALGGVNSIVSLAHNWISYIDTSGVPHQSQPACGDLSNSGTGCSATIANYLALAGGTMTGAITFAGGQTWPTFNQNTTGTAANLSGTPALPSGTTATTQTTTADTSTDLATDAFVHNAITAAGVIPVGSRPQQVQWGWQAGSSVGSSTVLYGPFPFAIATSIPTNDADSTGQGYFALNTAPAATWVATVYRIPAGGAVCSGTPSSIGTISVSTSNIATFSITATSFAKGDCWEFVAPSVVDTNAPIPASVGIYVLD